MRPLDIESLVVPSSLTVRGTLLVAAVGHPDLEADASTSSLRRVHLGGGDTAWTHGAKDSAPALSPDGQWLAFLRAGEGDGPPSHPQLHLAPTAGGEAMAVTALPLGAGAPAWAPDSRRLAFTARVAEPGRYGTPGPAGATVGADAEPVRRITRLAYREDDIGFLRDRPERLFVVDAVAVFEDSGMPALEPLTDDAADVSDAAWLPDGSGVLVVAPRDWGAADTLNSDLYVVPGAGGAPRLAVRTEGTGARPAFAEDGTLYFLGTSDADGHIEAAPTALYCATLEASGGVANATVLTDIATVDIEAGAGAPVPRGDGVIVAVRHRGAVELRRVPIDGDAPAPAGLDALPVVLAGRSVVHTFAADGDTLVAVVASPHSAGDVVLIGRDPSRPLSLTDYSVTLRDAGLRPVEELTGAAPDGYPVHGWLVLPEGEGPHPVLQVVHGGPFTQQDWGVFDEAQVYASAGYAVVLGNPRGSAGYGAAHGRAITGAMGTADVEDVLALLDVALERSDLDDTRVGIMGGSYGGFLTGWLASHHGDRFRAAWSERAVNAWDSFAGSSDIGWFFADAYVGADPEAQRAASPLTYAADIRIPFSVAHSEQDWRCPLEQGQRMFVALKRAGVDTQLVLFPGEGHELSRSGRPSHRVQRFDAVLEWWAGHLG